MPTQNTHNEVEEIVEEFTTELMEKARYVQGNQYPEDSEEYKAYQAGFESALAMVYIDLTGTPKSKGMLTTYGQSLVEKERERCNEDTKRLDFLDACNFRLNEKYQTNYGWKFILNHNVTRLMSERGLDFIDLNDAEGSKYKHKSCRDAIDEYLQALTPQDESNNN